MRPKRLRPVSQQPWRRRAPLCTRTPWRSGPEQAGSSSITCGTGGGRQRWRHIPPEPGPALRCQHPSRGRNCRRSAAAISIGSAIWRGACPIFRMTLGANSETLTRWFRKRNDGGSLRYVARQTNLSRMLVEGTFVGRVAAGMCGKILVSQGFKTPFDVAGDDAPGPDGLLFSCQARDTENECTFRYRRTKPSA
jgi:hypothetical protein